MTEEKVKPESGLAGFLARGNNLLIVSILALVITVSVWSLFTPAGIFGKADAVGYAVCHRIVVRSFAFPNGRPFPMCARDTGMFLGILIALITPGLLFRRRHAILFPPIGVIIIMVMASGIWAFDGANSFSYLLSYENIPRLYAPSNFLRIVTGMFHGITMGSIVLPVVNSTLWKDTVHERILSGFKELAILFLFGVIVIAMVLSGWGIFLYPLGLLTSVGTVTMLGVVNTIMITVIFKKENQAATLREALPMILLGLTAAFMLVGAIDAARFAMFGSWEGFVFPDA